MAHSVAALGMNSSREDFTLVHEGGEMVSANNLRAHFQLARLYLFLQGCGF